MIFRGYISNPRCLKYYDYSNIYLEQKKKKINNGVNRFTNNQKPFPTGPGLEEKHFSVASVLESGSSVRSVVENFKIFFNRFRGTFVFVR